MSGQGCPQYRRWSIRRAPPALLAAYALALTIPLLAVGAAEAKEGELRVRVAWGGGEARAWQGTIGLSEGTLSLVTPLGLEPDEPGSMLSVDAATIRIHPRTLRNYDGCDLVVQSRGDAKLIVQLWPVDAPASEPFEIPLSKLTRNFVQVDLDDRSNRLLAQRAPGDALRVKFGRDSLVFAPGETLELEVEPSALEVTASASYLLAAALGPARTEQQVWNEDREIRVDASGQPATASLKIPVPNHEGVYDLRLSLYPKRLTSSLVRGKPLASRKVQIVAVAPVKNINNRPAEWQSVLEFDPTVHRWWERLPRLPAWPRLPNLPQAAGGGVSSGPAITRNHLGRNWVELAPSGWTAYPLAIATPGTPHILEVEYPSDLEQTIGISLVEPNAAGKVGPIGLDSGVEVPPLAPGQQAEVQRHRLICWPQTRAPYVLVVNRRDNASALVGKIKVLAGPAELPAMEIPQANFATRTLTAYYDKPLFAENFSASEALDAASGRTFKDWVTFYNGGQRLMQTLRHGGYNAVVLTVACRGSAIYPSGLLEPTPEYDTGVFFDSGQDPIRKDVLELLLRLGDKNGIRVIPAVQFATPLPKLEAIRLSGSPAVMGLAPVGPDGRTWQERHGGGRPLGVYYNALDGRVQQAMVAVVEELAERYGHHASFGGVAVQLSTESHALLPDETCSYDDVTISHFLKETGTALPLAAASLPSLDTLAARSQFLHGPGSASWLAWRTAKLTGMYQRMRDVVTRQRADARLYLTPTELFSGQAIRHRLRPTLPPKDIPAGLLPLMGLDVERLVEEGIVVPRPQRIVSAASGPGALDRHWNTHPAIDGLFAKAGRGAAIHYLEAAPLGLPDFDAVSPFGPDRTRTLLISQLPPADAAQRERFVRSLQALDAPVVIDGGWMLPLGQEAALAPFAKVFRRLPAEAFSSAEAAMGSERPGDVIVRTLAKNGTTYFYAVNKSPWPVRAQIEFKSKEPVRLAPYGERQSGLEQQAGGAIWTVEMEPFDLVGGEVAGTKVEVADWRVVTPSEVAEALKERIRQVALRTNSLAQALRKPAPSLVNNPSFEAPQAAEGVIPGWVAAQGRHIVVEVDRQQAGATPSALYVVSRPDGMNPGPVVWVRSDPIQPRPTGRIRVMAQLRIAEAARQPRLRLAIEGKLDGQIYYRRANVGMSETKDGPPVTPLTTQWATYHFPLDDLPATGLTDLRVGFDLMGEGEVWIDDVQVYDLWLEPRERDELLNGVLTANVKLSKGQLAEAQAFAESYWPSFLGEHVELPQGALVKNAAPAAPKAAGPAAAAPPTAWDQIKGWMPSLPKWR